MAKRKAEAISPVKTRAAAAASSATPARTRASKKVRFSTSDLPAATNALPQDTTGLTPAVRKAGLSTPKRRTSTPARPSYIPSSPASEVDYVQFTPLRQALDERCKRRLRRNGLSEVVNEYQSEKRDNTHLRHEIRRKDQELKQLKDDLEQARHQALTSEQASQTEDVQSRVDEVEAELSQLRRSFGVEQSESEVNWDHVPRRSSGPRSEGGDTIPIFEDDADPYQADSLPPPVPAEDRVDATLMSLEVASARQAKQDMLRSFSRNSRSFDSADLNFADSPFRPREAASNIDVTPGTSSHELQKQVRLAKSRAEDAELALTALEGEVRALGFTHAADASASGSLTELADHFRSIRLDLERLMPGETTISFHNPALFPELVKKIKQLTEHLSARDKELRTLRDQEKSLRGNFEHAILASGKAELKIKELEKSIDDGAEETLHVRMRSQQLENDLKTSEADNKKLKSALEKYRDEQSRLEALISQIEEDHKMAMAKVQTSARNWETMAGDVEAKAAAETLGRRKAEESAVSRLAKIQDLEAALTKAKEYAEVTAEQLQSMQEKGTRHSQDVAERNTRIRNLSTALTSAEAEVSKLQVINQKLEERYRAEVDQGQIAFDKIQHEMIKIATRTIEQSKGYKRGSKVRLANWELESDDYPVGEDGMPMTPASMVRIADPEADQEGESERGDGSSSPASEHVPGSVEVGRGRKRLPLTPALGLKKRGRRRYDSGVGMSPLGEESEFEVDDSGFVTPDLSSEADVDMGVEA